MASIKVSKPSVKSGMKSFGPQQGSRWEKHAYVDRYLNSKGNWEYVYPEDLERQRNAQRKQPGSMLNQAKAQVRSGAEAQARAAKRAVTGQSRARDRQAADLHSFLNEQEAIDNRNRREREASNAAARTATGLARARDRQAADLQSLEDDQRAYDTKMQERDTQLARARDRQNADNELNRAENPDLTIFDRVKRGWDSFKKNVSSAISNTKTAIDSAIKDLKNWGSQTWESITRSSAKRTLETARSAGASQNIIDSLQKQANDTLFNRAANAAKSAWDGVSKAVETGFGKCKEGLDNAGKALGEAWSQVSEFATGNKAREDLQRASDRVESYGRDTAYSPSTEELRKAQSDYSAAKKAYGGTIPGAVENAISGITNTANDIGKNLNDLKDAAKQVWGKDIPDWFDARLKDISKFAENAGGAVTGVLNSLSGWLSSPAAQTTADVKNGGDAINKMLSNGQEQTDR